MPLTPARAPVVARTCQRLAGAAALLALSGCIYLPVTTQVYDADCRIQARQMSLQPVQLAAVSGCSNRGCVAILAAAGVTAAASAVVSGTLVVVGNVAYWLERQGRCLRVAPGQAGAP